MRSAPSSPPVVQPWIPRGVGQEMTKTGTGTEIGTVTETEEIEVETEGIGTGTGTGGIEVGTEGKGTEADLAETGTGIGGAGLSTRYCAHTIFTCPHTMLRGFCRQKSEPKPEKAGSKKESQ